MRISLRAIFGLVFISALAVFTWLQREEAGKAQARWEQRLEELTALRTELAANDPVIHQAIARTVDRSKLINQDDLSIKQALVDRVRRITPEAGVFSIRDSPSSRNKDNRGFRIHVPDTHPVWLRFGIWKNLNSMSSHEPEQAQIAKLLTASSHDHTGPFELRLEPGFHRINLSHRPTSDEQEQFVVSITDESSGSTQPLLTLSGLEPTSIKFEGFRWGVERALQADFRKTAEHPSLYWFSSRSGKYQHGVWASSQQNEFSQFPDAGDVK